MQLIFHFISKTNQHNNSAFDAEAVAAVAIATFFYYYLPKKLIKLFFILQIESLKKLITTPVLLPFTLKTV